MKFVYFNDTRFGAVDGSGTGVVDLTKTAARLPHRDRRPRRRRHRRLWRDRPGPDRRHRRRPGAALADVTLLPPLPAPRQIDCMAVQGTAPSTRRRRSARSTKASAASVPGAPWRCPTRQPRCLRERPNWRWLLAVRPPASAGNGPWTMCSVTSISSTGRRAACRPPTMSFPGQIARRVCPRGALSVTADEITDPQNLR